MATIYVDPSPSNVTNGSGSFASPRNIPPTSLAYGDIVLFKEGTTYASGWILPSPTGVGSDTNRITIGTYYAATGAQALSWSSMATISGTGSVDAILANGVSYVTVTGLRLIGGKNFPNAGFRGVSGSYWTVSNCEVYGNNYGIRFDNASGGPRSTWKALNNRITGTTGNAAIIAVWSATVGEYVTDITIVGNDISGTTENAPNAGGQGIFVVARANPCYTNPAQLKAKGLVVTDNILTGLPNKPISIYGVNAGGTQSNVVARNRLTNSGDGATDIHCIWMAGCEDFLVEENYVYGSNAWAGQSVGTGVGIFVDVVNISGANSDSCNNMVVRRNVVIETGRGATLNAEVGGGGIMVLQSTNVVVEANICDNCQNGVVVLGYYGTGIQTSNVDLRGNIATRSKRSGFYIGKVANLVAARNNIAMGGERGFYTENSGAGAITNYSEVDNLSYGATMNWAGGNEPTSGTPTITARSPAASNLTADPLFADNSRPWLGLKPGSPCQSAGAYIQGARDRFGRRYTTPPNIGPWAVIGR